MKRTQYFMGFAQGRALVQATACLLLTAGMALPARAAEMTVESSSAMTVQQTPITIRGTVKDALGDPIIGASVVEKGTGNGTVTDIDGNYTLRVNRSATIVVSYVGFATQEIPASPSAMAAATRVWLRASACVALYLWKEVIRRWYWWMVLKAV